MVRETFVKAWDRVKDGFVRFGVFHFCVVAFAVLAVLTNHDVVKAETGLNLIRGICWGALVGVFAQLVGEWRNRPLNKAVVAAITILVGALGCWFWISIAESSPRYWLWMMLYGGSVFSLFAASAAVLSAYSDEKTLVPRLLLNTLGSCGAAAIFSVSQAVCLLAFDQLVMKVDYRLYFDVTFVPWVVIATIGFISFLPGRGRDDDSSDRATAFLFWLLLPAALLLLGILYLYLGKIVAMWSMPSGKLNWFGSVALAAYVFFWLSLRGSERRFFRLFARWGWALMLPVLTAQVIGIIIRYQAYGLSTPRLTGMVALTFGVVTLILAALDRRPMWLFVYMAVAGLVFTVSPVNIIDLPVRNQEGRLAAALERNGFLKAGKFQFNAGAKVSYKDAKIIAGAWRYLVADGTINGSWWSGGLEPGRIAPTVWHGASFTSELCGSLRGLKLAGQDANDPLLRLLNLDKIAGRNLDGKKRTPLFATMNFRLAGDGMLPVDGYSRFKVIDNGPGVQCFARRPGKWVVQIASPGKKDWDEYEVTDSVERVFKNSGCNGVVVKDLKFNLTADEAFWPLDPDKTLVIGSFGTSGTVGNKIRYVNLANCALMTKSVERSARPSNANDR